MKEDITYDFNHNAITRNEVIAMGHITQAKQLIKDNWTPSTADLDWTHNLIRIIKQGGLWGTSHAIYQLDHKHKTLIEVELDQDTKNHERVRTVFKILGWHIQRSFTDRMTGHNEKGR